MSGESQFELDRRELAEAALATTVVVGVLDPGDDGEMELLAGPPHPLLVEDVLLQERVERLHCGVVGRGGDPAHRPLEPVHREQALEAPRAEGTPAVRVNDDGAVGVATREGVAQ